jgi:hypothetical protein
MHDEAERYVASLNRKVQPLADAAHANFVAEGCSSYVKTIYIGYDIDGIMVAALYGHTDHLEIALALPEDHPSGILVDATHLTWRTLPVAAILRSGAELADLRVLVAEACGRIRFDRHDVVRDNDFFVHARRERRHR